AVRPTSNHARRRGLLPEEDATRARYGRIADPKFGYRCAETVRWDGSAPCGGRAPNRQWTPSVELIVRDVASKSAPIAHATRRAVGHRAGAMRDLSEPMRSRSTDQLTVRHPQGQPLGLWTRFVR